MSDITAQEVHKLITDNQGNDNFVILDVRAPQEFASGYIEGAINFNYIASNFKEEIEKLDRNKTYLVYCQSGRRSSAATKIMQELGFEDVYNMQGGFSQWQAENLSVVKE
ncbi:sulfurtransferase [Candidatus Curtissbacteria bacterium RBG_13_35_7]|uniref:Sulfurtransferase n=1 Tax=Candidatus Curtissbacteria bacterium RBG_13_35_7 TaxID=1797705 RepID=A0A1F5G5B5_9BACT|nr:MAG: sulfurtransferase [Candidatus Curtissbacteria bacterium RBG_13_35_7]